MSFQSNRIAMAAVAVAGMAISTAALATTATTTYNVTATVQSTCLISGSNLAFGTYSGSAIALTTTLSVTCSNGTTYNVGLNAVDNDAFRHVQ